MREWLQETLSSQGHASSFPAGPGSRPGLWGAGAAPSPFPLSGPSLLSATASSYSSAQQIGAEARKCLSTLLSTEQEVYTASNGRRAHLLGPALCREKQAVSVAQGVLSTVEALGCRAGVYLAPRPPSQSPVFASVAHPHSTKGPQGSPILTPGCKTEKADWPRFGDFLGST